MLAVHVQVLQVVAWRLPACTGAASAAPRHSLEPARPPVVLLLLWLLVVLVMVVVSAWLGAGWCQQQQLQTALVKAVSLRQRRMVTVAKAPTALQWLWHGGAETMELAGQC